MWIGREVGEGTRVDVYGGFASKKGEVEGIESG